MDRSSIQKKTKMIQKIAGKRQVWSRSGKVRKGGRIAHVQEAPLPFSEAIR